MTKITMTTDMWFNPARQEACLFDPQGYYLGKKPRERKGFVTTEGVGRAVFYAAYQRRLTPSQIKYIWGTVGQNFAAQVVEAEFKELISGVNLEKLFNVGYSVTGGPILLRGGRKCVAIRVLGDLLYREMKSQRLFGHNEESARKSIDWYDFTDRLAGLLVKSGLASETLTSDYLASELGL